MYNAGFLAQAKDHVTLPGLGTRTRRLRNNGKPTVSFGQRGPWILHVWDNENWIAYFKMAASWNDLSPTLSTSVLKIMQKFGFKSMTPVQVDKEII